jgi:hypothetical protein
MQSIRAVQEDDLLIGARRRSNLNVVPFAAAPITSDLVKSGYNQPCFRSPSLQGVF